MNDRPFKIGRLVSWCYNSKENKKSVLFRKFIAHSFIIDITRSLWINLYHPHGYILILWDLNMDIIFDHLTNLFDHLMDHLMDRYLLIISQIYFDHLTDMKTISRICFDHLTDMTTISRI